MMLDQSIAKDILVGFVVGYLLIKIHPFIDKLFALMKEIVVGKLPKRIRGIVRGRRLKNVIKLKENRRNMAAINYQIAKANSAYILFILFAVFYIYLIMGPLRPFLEMGIWVSFLICLPVYVLEGIWLTADAKARQLVSHAGKVRTCKVNVADTINLKKEKMHV